LKNAIEKPERLRGRFGSKKGRKRMVTKTRLQSETGYPKKKDQIKESIRGRGGGDSGGKRVALRKVQNVLRGRNFLVPRKKVSGATIPGFQIAEKKACR